MKIQELSDFPALEQLARALWREGTARGAAVLVGAGFSKNAERPGIDTPEPPLWGDLAAEMTKQLYAHSPDEAPKDSLRLAEEYRAYFGQAALDEFIRTRILDHAWEPGLLHRSLLELPWSEVLTTNYDTLLERTALTAADYEIVRTTSDLAHAGGRRIIKLHGSIGTSEHFIIAEEDYRTYPTRFAAFVNLARQVFIENEFCLLGFSGDDPNFLQWSGWVRDHLGDSTRRIYLVGAFGLGSAKRKLLEARNVAPIDLAPLVKGKSPRDRQKSAISIFLKFLSEAKPKAQSSWMPAPQTAYDFLPTTLEDMKRQGKDAEYAASLLDKAAEVWKRDRETYPQWLVCPTAARQHLRFGTMRLRTSLPAALSQCQPSRRAEILYEIAWRHAVSYWPIDDQLAALLATVADPSQPCGLSINQQLEIVAILMRTARRSGDNAAFLSWVGVFEKYSEPETDFRAEIAYQRCLVARDRLDYSSLSTEMRIIGGQDPVWRLRRASLHCELGEFAEASSLISEASFDIDKRQRRDRNSLWVRSRRAWVEWLARVAKRDHLVIHELPWPWEFKMDKCDPEDEIDQLKVDVGEALRKRREESLPITPLFQPGHYKDASDTVRLESAAIIEPREVLDQLAESVGLPIRLNRYSMFGHVASDATELVYRQTFDWYVRFLREVGSHSNRSFERYFGRIAIATLPDTVASSLCEQVTAAIAFWRKKVATIPRGNSIDFIEAVGRLQLFIEAMSRLTVRQDTNVAQQSFDLAQDLAHDSSLNHPWLVERIANLASYSAQAVPLSDRHRLVLSALEFPLGTEKGMDQGPFRWLRPMEAFFGVNPNRPSGDTRWVRRIEALLLASNANNPGRPEAVLRLHYLATHEGLTDDEREAFGLALWSETDGMQFPLPSKTDLLPHTFVQLPAPTGIDVVRSVCSRLFDTDIKGVLAPPQPMSSYGIADNTNQIRAIWATAQSKLRPTGQQACVLFDNMTSWCPSCIGDGQDSFGAQLLRSFYSGVRPVLGQALAYVVVPSLAPEDLTPARARSLMALIKNEEVHAARVALPYFADAGNDILGEIIQCIRRGVGGRRFEEVAGGTAAIEVWTNIDRDCGQTTLPKDLVVQVLSAIETRYKIGMTALLHCARHLVELNRLTAEEEMRLVDALGDLIDDTRYEAIDPDSREATSASLVRLECVQLASALRSRHAHEASVQAWLDAGRLDPLPEVRFVLNG
jgi:SIR2-like domain